MSLKKIKTKLNKPPSLHASTVCGMNNRREYRSSRASLLDGYESIEEGGIRADEHSNDTAITSLQDRVTFLKRLTGDIHEEVETHNRVLERMGNGMDSSRGILSTTMDRYKMVIEKKTYRGMCKLAASFVVSFFVIYYLLRVIGYFMHS